MSLTPLFRTKSLYHSFRSQFRRRQLFGEPHPCPLMTHEELDEAILGGEAGNVVRGEFGAGTKEIGPVDPAGARVSDDIGRSDRADGLGDRLQDAGPQPRVKRCVMNFRDDALERDQQPCRYCRLRVSSPRNLATARWLPRRSFNNLIYSFG